MVALNRVPTIAESFAMIDALNAPGATRGSVIVGFVDKITPASDQALFDAKVNLALIVTVPLLCPRCVRSWAAAPCSPDISRTATACLPIIQGWCQRLQQGEKPCQARFLQRKSRHAAM